MRRAEAIVVIVALLAIPLALLARRGSCEQAQCMCCLLHGAEAQHGKGMSCSHCAGQKCAMNSGHSRTDYGLIAPMAPTAPAARVVLAVPEITRRAFVLQAPAVPAGFLGVPFQPPRG
jgi:hypothetical protein